MPNDLRIVIEPGTGKTHIDLRQGAAVTDADLATALPDITPFHSIRLVADGKGNTTITLEGGPLAAEQ